MEGESVSLGGGQATIEWAERHAPHITVLDMDPQLSSETVRVEVADALSIRRPDGSVAYIYADFLVNAVYLTGITPADIISNPDVLMGDIIPLLVRNWYVGFVRPFNPQADLKEVRWLVRRVVLDEMLRVLSVGGEIYILDHYNIILWAEQVLRSYPGIVVSSVLVTAEDYARSGSLRKLADRPEKPPIGKLRINKYF
ncbi:MAG: hypothetical protein ABIE03_06975 [Patescibacteria group bacterium]|nr:hypothetical protein [Patescibacteria group bacterium]